MPRTTDLTATEREVLGDIARGLNNIQIGLKQCRSPETIRTHTKNIYAKLKARNRPHAVAIAYDTGILRCPHPHLPLAQAIPPLCSPPICEPGRRGRAAHPPTSRRSAPRKPTSGGRR